MKRKTKLLLFIGLIIISLGIYRGAQYHHNDRRSPSFHTKPTLVDHTNYSKVGNLIGQHRLIKHLKRAPKLKLAKSVVAMDAKTGRIIYARNDNQPRKVASIAKLMTLFLVEQKANRLHKGWQRTVNTSDPRLQKMSRDRMMGGFEFKPHHRYTVKDLFKAALIQSSNNSAIALGQWVSGSNSKFVRLMNAQARAWHLKADFISASGLENNDLQKYHLAVTSRKSEGNVISAKSVAIIAQHLLAKYPTVLQDSKRLQTKVAGQQLNNLDKLLPGKVFADRKLKVDGLKTGFTPRAGYCFVGTEKPRHKDRIITVVLHDSKDFTDTRNLMKFINQNY